ncbi:MAG: UDP-N-acetylmuramate dehydrogenase [Clostridia bacterium]|nr:UDP-N-acetylmuramate dehydrogenase [Clostridia bacterium]
MDKNTALIEIFEKEGIECAAALPLSSKSSFKIGGKADVAVFPKNASELEFIIGNLDMPYIVVGNGSNILFEDEGYLGCVIFTEKMNSVKVESNRLHAGAGASFTAMATAAKNASLTGLEFAYGIPGSCGGAVVMNAGAYGGQVSDVLESCTVFDAEKREVYTLAKEEMNLSYRHSILSENKNLICLGATFTLKEGKKEEIDATMRDLMQRRISKQPLEYPSAGSVFKRPAPDLFVGKMIEDSGLKGYTVGGAQVSEKHAGFIINVGGATASDVLGLVEHIQKVIRANYGVELECEIRRVGNGK